MPTLINTAPIGSVLAAVVTSLNALITDIADIRTKFNAHQHTETGTTTAAVAGGSQAVAATAKAIVTKI